MVDVQPLRGLRYTRTAVEDLAQVITPPFDVISKEAQTRYYARHPYNVVRLELGQAYEDDNTLNTVYSRAAATLAEWRLQGVLSQDPSPCYYCYQQHFRYGDQSYTRTSLLARVRLEDWEARTILPHENTRTKDKEDRLHLLQACATNLSPIMCMYDDPQGRLRRLLNDYAKTAEVQIVDEVGEGHRLQPISDPEQIALIRDFFAPRQLYIADGHHRYTTALTYRSEVLAQRLELDPQDGVNFVLMALIDVEDPGMLVLPTHRLLFDLSAEALAELTPEQLATFFTVHALEHTISDETALEQLAQVGQQQASLLLKTAEQTLLLSINDQGRLRMQESQHSAAWNALDVSIVQQLILEQILHITAEDIAAGRYVRYAHDSQQALQALRNGEAQAIIALNGLPFRAIRDVALADDRMPQKSTYLYPKLATGLVMNPLW